LAVNKEQRLKHALDLGIKVDDEDKWMLEDYLWHVRPSDGHVITLFPYGDGTKEVRLDNCVMGLFKLPRHQ
jgi:hypothetical protein